MILVLLSGFLQAQEHENIEQISTYGNYWSSLGDIHISGDYAFATGGVTGLLVFDLTHPYVPELVLRWDGNLPWTNVFALNDNLCYVGHPRTGFSIVEISDPEHPFEISRTQGTCNTYSIVEKDGFVYIIDRTDDNMGLRIFNVEDPEHPEEIAFLQEFLNPSLILTIGDYVYIKDYPGDHRGQLKICDVSDPQNPELIRTIEFDHSIRQMAYKDSTAYISYSNRQEKGFFIFDISSTADPELIGSVELAENYIRNILIYDDYLCTVDDDDFAVFEISNPHEPFEIQRIGGFNDGRMAQREDHIYIASRNGLSVIDLSDIDNPRNGGTISNPGEITRVTSKANTPFFCHNSDDMSAISLDNPERIEILDHVRPGFKKIDFENNIGVVARGGSTAEIWDFTDPLQPRYLERYFIPGEG